MPGRPAQLEWLLQSGLLDPRKSKDMEIINAALDMLGWIYNLNALVQVANFKVFLEPRLGEFDPLLKAYAANLKESGYRLFMLIKHYK